MQPTPDPVDAVLASIAEMTAHSDVVMVLKPDAPIETVIERFTPPPPEPRQLALFEA